MRIDIDPGVEAAAVGGMVADALRVESYVHVAGLDVLELAGQEQTDYIWNLAGAIGSLATIPGRPGTEIWPLDSRSSPLAQHVPFHTDNPFLEEPEEVLGFISLRSSSLGGENLVLPMSTLLDFLTSEPSRRTTLQRLTVEPVRFVHGPDEVQAPIVDLQAETVRFDQKYVAPANHGLASEFAAILSEAEGLAAAIKLSPGDALFFGNTQNLHARTVYQDPNRLSLRVRLKTDA